MGINRSVGYKRFNLSGCFLLICIFSIFTNISGQESDRLNSNKHAIKFFYFKKNLSISNAILKLRYCLNKNPLRKHDSLPGKSGWILTFSDEFDSLDTKKWRLGQPWGEIHPDNPHQYYSASEVSVKNSLLYLGGTPKPKAYKIGDSMVNVPLAIGLINSDISFKQKYGYFEIRSKNPSGPATWPAFWLTGAAKWPPEIDIFEMYGRKTGKSVHNQYATLHWGKNNTRSMGFLSKKINLPNNSDTMFHTYACEWTPDYIKFYTDGRAVARIRMNKRLRLWMDEEMVIIINNCFDKNYLKYLPADFKGNSFVIDYVRVYQKNSSLLRGN